MRKTLFFVSLCIAAGAAQAQIKCWNDANGKRVCGDAPPAGAKVTTLKAPSGPAAPAPAADAKDGKAASKGPLTPTEQEQAYRKRQAEEKKAAEKTAAADKEAATKRENCERARAALRQYETGQRITSTDAKGERVYLDDAQVAQESAKARQAVQELCN
ncbi:MAG: DUF4124 domain-containing protein [Burkholderiales bacterium]